MCLKYYNSRSISFIIRIDLSVCVLKFLLNCSSDLSKDYMGEAA